MTSSRLLEQLSHDKSQYIACLLLHKQPQLSLHVSLCKSNRINWLSTSHIILMMSKGKNTQVIQEGDQKSSPKWEEFSWPLCWIYISKSSKGKELAHGQERRCLEPRYPCGNVPNSAIQQCQQHYPVLSSAHPAPHSLRLQGRTQQPEPRLFKRRMCWHFPCLREISILDAELNHNSIRLKE